MHSPAVATDLGNGRFAVEDAHAHRFTSRFYRVVTP
jgi:hypothetical protein